MTIIVKQIAEQVGISKTAVSLYFRDPNTARVSFEKKIKIRQVVDKYGYDSNLLVSHFFIFVWITVIVFVLGGHQNLLFSQSIDNMEIMTEEYPPFNFLKIKKAFIKDNQLNNKTISKKEKVGIALDLMVSMLEKSNSKLGRSDIVFVPWARGYRTVMVKRNTCLFSTARTEQRERLFKWVGPIASVEYGLIGKKSRTIIIRNLNDIQKYRIGTVIDDGAEQTVLKAGVRLKDLDRMPGTNVIMRSIIKLKLNRIDLFAYEVNGTKWKMKAMQVSFDDYEVVYILKRTEIYYAFNLNTPTSIIKVLQSALDELKKDGTYQKIENRYLVPCFNISKLPFRNLSCLVINSKLPR